jgi:hypothetical protein
MDASRLQAVRDRPLQSALAAVALVAALFLLLNAPAAVGAADGWDRFRTVGNEAAPPAGGTTVFASHDEGDLVAVGPDGRVVYHEGRYDGYFDVDPSPVGERTVLFVATVEGVPGCDPVAQGPCSRQVVERVNLSTGARERLFSRAIPRSRSNEWHDVDRVGPNRFLVADTNQDVVFEVNTTTGLETWRWDAQSYLNVTTGGPYPNDWTHLNDVEALPDGRVMVSLRNQDQVVFVGRDGRVDDAWTLGAEGDHDVLFKQHQPDYIPASRGGPAVVVADSVNHRLVEFQYERGGDASGEWVETWHWRDPRMEWTRDADRLPNGNTLATDTRGGRLLEIAPSGEVVWALDLPRAYEAERLGTGDESAGGPSATRADLQSVREGTSPAANATLRAKAADVAEGPLPPRLVTGFHAVAPPWFDVFDLGACLALVGALLGLGGLRLRAAGYRLRLPLARR